MKTIRTMATAAFMGLAGILVSSGAHADDQGGVTVDSIKKAGVLRVGTWLQYEPEMWKDLKTGEIKGFWVDMARKMGDDLGVKVEFVDSDWDGLIPGIQARKFDIILAQMAITSKRSLAVDFAKPWEAVGLSAVLPADSTCDNIACLNSADKTISTEIGSVDQDAKKAIFPTAKESANKGHNDGFLQVMSKRSDAFLTDNVSAANFAKAHPGAVKIAWDGVKQPFLQAFPGGPALPKGSLDFARWVDTWLQEQINNGTYRELYLKDIGWEPALKELMLQRGGYPD
jgi:polar amino acid transport system substrate-binding protein